MVFALFFSTFLYYRAQSVAQFREAATHLNQSIGVLNTLLMLSSSWFVATAVKAARRDMRTAATSLLGGALFCGAGFVAAKFCEYRAEILAGFTLNTNDFFVYYYMFTGIHLLHVLIGMGLLGFMARYVAIGQFDMIKMRNLESGASFWHLVDLLWIVLFPLLYLVR